MVGVRFVSLQLQHNHNNRRRKVQDIAFANLKTKKKILNYLQAYKFAVCVCSVEETPSEEDLGRPDPDPGPGPAETLTIAGLSNLSPRTNPLLNSSITTPSLNSFDSSRAIAS